MASPSLYDATNIRVEVTPTDVLYASGSDGSTGQTTCNAGGVFIFGSDDDSTAKKAEDGHREYIIHLSWLGATEDSLDEMDSEGTSTMIRFWTFQERFSELRRRFVDQGQLVTNCFPPRGCWTFTDYTHSLDNVLVRAKHLHFYLDVLMNHRGSLYLLSPSLHHALGIKSDPAAYATIQTIGQRRQALERAGTLRQQRRLARIREHEQAACQKALNVTDLAKPLTFHYEQVFELATRFLALGSRDIKGPGGRPWFRFERTESAALTPWANRIYCIATKNGVPLVKLVERFRPLDYVCDLYYVTAPSGETDWALRVQRKFQISWEEQYTVTTKNSWQRHRIDCGFKWLEGSIRVNGAIAATVSQHFLAATPTFRVCVKPDQDCLMMLAIGCAVARIHDASRKRSSATLPITT